MRGQSLLAALLATGTFATATAPAMYQPVAAAAPPPPHVLSVSIGQASVVRAASSIDVSFNVPMDVASARFASTLVVAEGSQAKREVEAPVSAGSKAGGRTVVLDFARAGQHLPPGAYSLVVGPAAAAADGAVLGYASVTDFVVAPDPSLWEEVTVSGHRYQVWVDATGGLGPVRGDEFLLKGDGGTVLSGGQHVSVVYATDAQRRLVTNAGLASELENYAEEEGWLRLQPPSSVPGALALDPNTVTWAVNNGPGSALGNYLYGLAKELGEDVASPPSQSDVDQAEVTSALSYDGAPGSWAAELSSDGATLDLAKTADKSYVLAQQLTTVISEGTLSLPGAGAAKALLDVLKTVSAAVGFSEGTLQQLYQAEWEAAEAAAEAVPLQTIVSALPSGDAYMASDISALVHFTLAGEQAAIARAAATYASQQAYDLSADLAKELVADSDPMAAAVVAGLDAGFFIASFTGWDELRAGLYQAAEQAKAEKTLVDAAKALEGSIAATTAPSSATLDAALLAWRMARNTMADFYAECVRIVHLDQWGQAVDSAFPGLDALVGTHPAEDNVPQWSSDESYDRQQAEGLVPGVPKRSGENALAAVITRFPAVPTGVVPVSLCGTVISEPGHYVQRVQSLQSPGPYTGQPCYGNEFGIEVVAPGASVDLNGHYVVGADQAGLWLGPQAAGSLVTNGTITAIQCCTAGLGIADLAPGVLATHLQVSDYQTGLLAVRTEGSRFMGNIVDGFGNGVGPWPGLGTISDGGVSLDHADDVTVGHNKVSGVYGSVDIVLQGSSGNQVEDNALTGGREAIYAGCNGFVTSPPAHPLTHTTCAPSTGNLVMGNHVQGTSADATGPAIAFDSSTAHNVISSNRVDWPSDESYYLWDYNSCGVNTWDHNVVSPDPPLGGSHLSNWACIK